MFRIYNINLEYIYPIEFRNFQEIVDWLKQRGISKLTVMTDTIMLAKDVKQNKMLLGVFSEVSYFPERVSAPAARFIVDLFNRQVLVSAGGR